MSDRSPTVSASTEIDAFLTRMQGLSAKTTTVSGRLIFALDATASRQPTWDTACQLQADMFREVATLSVQLVYYRGLSECRSSRWLRSPNTSPG
jgi:hypothetical protein